MERLQKILSAAGVTSRRNAETLMLEGRVTVNGQVVRELGTKADSERDHIKVDGRRVGRFPGKVYLLLNKPKGVVSTVSDPQRRPVVTDLVRGAGRIYPVGRLDYNTEGLILLTNDGEFARIVSRAGNDIPRTYHAKVKGTVEETGLERMRSGIRATDGTRFAPAWVRPLRAGNNSWYEVKLTEGKNHEVRRMFDAVGHPVLKLRRVGIGFLTDHGLEVGAYRPLEPHEVKRLMKAK
jgi:23S rRNA pseudouridine2605 synthase